MNLKEKAEEYIAVYNDLQKIASKLRPIEERFLGMDGLGSAGMQVEGVYEDYMKEAGYRTNIVEQLKKIREEVGVDKQKEFVAEINKIPGGEKAGEYLRRTTPIEKSSEKSFFRRIFK